MLIVNSFDAIPKMPSPIAITIGSFDGLHLGHRAIFKRLRALAPTGTTAIITFSNHPSEVLSPNNPTKLIYTPEQKVKTLKTLDIDLCVLLSFTKETASNTYDQFLLALKEKLPFDYLVLGYNAVLGKGRTGTPSALQSFAKKHEFSLEYLPAVKIDGEPVSSGRIRKLLADGKTNESAKLLDNHEI